MEPQESHASKVDSNEIWKLNKWKRSGLFSQHLNEFVPEDDFLNTKMISIFFCTYVQKLEYR